MKIISMQEIEAMYVPGISRHWFDADTMRFFKTRLAQVGYQHADGSVYFVTSEKPPYGERRYSVRRLTGFKGDIQTIGEFCGYKNAATANKYAEGYASGNIPLPEKATV